MHFKQHVVQIDFILEITILPASETLAHALLALLHMIDNTVSTELGKIIHIDNIVLTHIGKCLVKAS